MVDVVFTGIAPVIPVRDLDAALERFRRLGFDTHAYPGPDRYGYADRDAVSLHLTEWPKHVSTGSGASFYLYVDDADALYAEWVVAGVGGHFHEPHDTAYRLREFGYVDPDGTRVRVGSPLSH